MSRSDLEATSKKPPTPRARRRVVDAAWETMIDRITQRIESAETKARDPDALRSPYERPLSILKQEVYEFVNRHEGKEQKVAMKEVFEIRHENIKVRKRFEDNHYFWAFKAIEGSGEDIPVKFAHLISELADHLLYARLHGMNSQLLIGFLHQVGGDKSIEVKLKEGTFEPWRKKGGKWIQRLPKRRPRRSITGS